MKLEPVYLVAPKPKPPSVPTRRAFLIAGGTFLAGAGLGGACGYAAGSRVGSHQITDELSSTGDAVLDELRRLAIKAPIAELFDKRMLFLEQVSLNYRDDKVLWQGVERLCDEIVSNPNIKARRRIAGWISTVISRGNPELTSKLRPRIVELQRLK